MSWMEVGKRNKGNHIGRTDAGMFPLMVVEVDQFCCSPDGAEGSLLHSKRRSGERDDGTVMVEVGGAVEQARSFHGGNGGYDLVYDFRPPCFGKVGNAFD